MLLLEEKFIIVPKVVREDLHLSCVDRISEGIQPPIALIEKEFCIPEFHTVFKTKVIVASTGAEP